MTVMVFPGEGQQNPEIIVLTGCNVYGGFISWSQPEFQWSLSNCRLIHSRIYNTPQRQRKFWKQPLELAHLWPQDETFASFHLCCPFKGILFRVFFCVKETKFILNAKEYYNAPLPYFKKIFWEVEIQGRKAVVAEGKVNLSSFTNSK